MLFWLKSKDNLHDIKKYEIVYCFYVIVMLIINDHKTKDEIYNASRFFFNLNINSV